MPNNRIRTAILPVASTALTVAASALLLHSLTNYLDSSTFLVRLAIASIVLNSAALLSNIATHIAITCSPDKNEAKERRLHNVHAFMEFTAGTLGMLTLAMIFVYMPFDFDKLPGAYAHQVMLALGSLGSAILAMVQMLVAWKTPGAPATTGEQDALLGRQPVPTV